MKALNPKVRRVIQPPVAAVVKPRPFFLRNWRSALSRSPIQHFLTLLLLATSLFPARAQTNALEPGRAYEQATERIRAQCVQGRRVISGRIEKILPEGLIIDSGYTSLMRPPLSKSWLVPGTVQATRDANLTEATDPGSVCVGLVYLTSLPKSRAAKPKLYDYVVLTGYPAGNYTYTSVGTVQRTVRRFAASLQPAIRLNRDLAGVKPPVVPH